MTTPAPANPSSAYTTASTYAQHADYRRGELANSNHADQRTTRCAHCNNLFDVGIERLRKASFRPYCSPECFERRPR